MDIYNAPSGYLPSFTWANKPATYATGQPVFISNAGTKGSHWYYDGARWKLFGNQALMASLDASSSAINNSETIALQYQFPAGMLQLQDRIRIYYSISKSGTTDTGTMRLHVGTAGTTGDALINNAASPQLAAAARQLGMAQDFRIETATTLQPLGVSNGGDAKTGYSSSQAGAVVAALTISNISNSLFFSMSALSSSTNDTLVFVDAQIWLISPAN